MTWLFKSRTTPGVYTAASGGAWQQIAKALPDRTTQQVSYCMAMSPGTRTLTLPGEASKCCAMPGAENLCH
jgi:hypothetical protein